MFNFICKSFYHMKHCGFVKSIPTHELYALRLSLFSTEALKPASDYAKDESFTVNYLIKTCGFEPEKAVSASKYVNFNKPDTANAAIAFLKNQGFSEKQVFDIVKKYPSVIALDSEKNLLPKIEFFRSQGISDTDLLFVLLVVPYILGSSLKKEIVPSFACLRNLMGNSENAMMVIRRWPRILLFMRRIVVPNVEILRQAGVPEARIRKLLTLWPGKIIQRSDRYKQLVNKVTDMGIDPRKTAFVIGVMAMTGMSTVTWEKKMKVYKKWGCSEDDVLIAFKTCPWCMLASADKINGIMKFLVSKMGWKSSMLIKSPPIFALSLKRRIIPRCSVLRVLLSKGLIKQTSSLSTVLKVSEKKFLEIYVKRHEEKAPQLFKLYQKKLELINMSIRTTIP